MRALVLLNLIKESGKKDIPRFGEQDISFFATSLINPFIHLHVC